MARGVDRAAVVLRADVDMHRGRRHAPGGRRIAERRVERRILVRHHDELGRRPAERVRLGDRLLHEHDLRAGIEEHVVDAAEPHGGDDGVAALIGRNLVQSQVRRGAADGCALSSADFGCGGGSITGVVQFRWRDGRAGRCGAIVHVLPLLIPDAVQRRQTSLPSLRAVLGTPCVMSTHAPHPLRERFSPAETPL